MIRKIVIYQKSYETKSVPLLCFVLFSDTLLSSHSTDTKNYTSEER